MKILYFYSLIPIFLKKRKIFLYELYEYFLSRVHLKEKKFIKIKIKFLKKMEN